MGNELLDDWHMIKIVGRDGFEFYTTADRITTFGIERGEDVLFVVIDGKEWRVSKDVDQQYEMLRNVLKSNDKKVGFGGTDEP